MKNKGFTLVELMIVVAIMSILAAIAVPQYNQYVIKAKLSEGVRSLASAKVSMEQYFQDNGAYNTTPTASSITCGNSAPSATADFTYTCTATSTTYLVTMTGQAALAGYAYTINQRDQRTTTATPNGATSTTCWVVASGC